MPYCPKCGSETSGNFCASCGAPLSAPSPQPAGGPPPPAGAQPALDRNLASALCYLAGLITGILFLVLEPYSRDQTIRFHALQSIFASVAFFVIEGVLTVLSGIWLIGVLFIFIMGFVVPLGAIALWIMLMYKAYHGERLVLPVIGPLAEKHA
jgi:uncharacterized membrane protein